MNKKAGKKTYDDKEDLVIKETAYYKSSSQVLLLVVLIVLFGFTLYNSLMYIGKYYINKNKLDSDVEVIEIKTNKNSILINNEGFLEKEITSDDEEEIIITKQSSIVLETYKDEEKNGTIKFDVKYNILENSFPGNLSSKEDSDIRVRFAYSYDGETWNYINNVISTYETTLSPLVGNYYDISGITSTLKIATNFELSCDPGLSKTMYWKSETIIKNNTNNIGKNIKSAFKIDYKESL